MEDARRKVQKGNADQETAEKGRGSSKESCKGAVGRGPWKRKDVEEAGGKKRRRGGNREKVELRVAG